LRRARVGGCAVSSPDRHLEPSADGGLEPQCPPGVPAAQECRMRLDDDPLEAGDTRRNPVILVRRNGVGVEEAPGVIELDLARGGQPRKRVANLLRDVPAADGSVECVYPEVAHQAAERALPVGDQHDDGGGLTAVSVLFQLPPRRVRTIRSDGLLRAAPIFDPSIERGCDVHAP
jgi:hypothetical protein